MPTAKKRKVAVFDIDGTIFRSSLLIELVDALIHEGIFKPEAAKIYERHKENWLDRKGSYDIYIMSVVRAFRAHLTGVRYEDFSRAAEKVVSLHKHRVYRYPPELISELKRKKYYLVAVSHSPKIIVEAFAKTLGFDKIYGMMYEVSDKGKFTGNILHEELIRDKAAILLRAAEVEHLTLAGSVGMGDTESDIPVLRMVTRPICFNPNKKLYGYAKRRGWEIVVERKDMIYKL